MATSKGSKRGIDEQQLEGGGGGGGNASGISGTKWSSMPSLKSNASTMDDLKKIVSDTSKLKGGAKAAKEEAIDRAITRTVVRAGAAGAAGATVAAGIKSATATEGRQSNGSDNEFMGSAKRDSGNPTEYSGTGMAKGGMVNKKKMAYNAVYMGKDKRK
jgi:hypothetical protein